MHQDKLVCWFLARRDPSWIIWSTIQHFFPVLGYSVCSGDMFPSGRAVLLWQRRMLPLEELYCSGRDTFPSGRDTFPSGRALFPEKKEKMKNQKSEKWNMEILKKIAKSKSKSKKHQTIRKWERIAIGRKFKRKKKVKWYYFWKKY